jgi:hypothetical protein
MSKFKVLDRVVVNENYPEAGITGKEFVVEKIWTDYREYPVNCRIVGLDNSENWLFKEDELSLITEKEEELWV